MSFFNKNIISLKPKFFGIDISDRAVRIFQIERSESGDKLQSFSSAIIKKGSIENGKIIEKSEVVFSIGEALKKASPKKINTRKVICSLPESKIFLRIITLPKMAEAEAEKAIKWEMEANIPLPIDAVYFAWQFIEEVGNDNQRVLTVAVHKEIVDNLRDVLERAGLEPYVFESKSISNARSLIADNAKEALNLIVDLGSVKTNVTIVENGIPCFALSVPFSSESINDAIVKKINADSSEIAKIRTNQGIENFAGNNPVLGLVESVMENLAVEIENTLDFYANSAEKTKEADKIIISGEGANLKGLADYLKNRLKKNVEIGNPWINLRLHDSIPFMDKEEAVKFSTAIGLALRGIYYED